MPPTVKGKKKPKAAKMRLGEARVGAPRKPIPVSDYFGAAKRKKKKLKGKALELSLIRASAGRATLSGYTNLDCGKASKSEMKATSETSLGEGSWVTVGTSGMFVEKEGSLCKQFVFHMMQKSGNVNFGYSEKVSCGVGGPAACGAVQVGACDAANAAKMKKEPKGWFLDGGAADKPAGKTERPLSEAKFSCFNKCRDILSKYRKGKRKLKSKSYAQLKQHMGCSGNRLKLAALKTPATANAKTLRNRKEDQEKRKNAKYKKKGKKEMDEKVYILKITKGKKHDGQRVWKKTGPEMGPI